MTMTPPRNRALRVASLALVVLGGAATLASAPVPESAVRLRLWSVPVGSDPTHVKFLLSGDFVPEKCFAGCSGEDQLAYLERFEVDPHSCSTVVRVMVVGRGRPHEATLVEKSPDPRCNEAALAWARNTRWEEPEPNQAYGLVQPFGQVESPPASSTAEIAVSQWSAFIDERTPAFLLSGDPAFDLESDLAVYERLAEGFQGWIVHERRNARGPAACMLGRSGDGRLVLRMIDEREAAVLLADTLDGSEVERLIRELAPDLEPFEVGALFGGGACLVLLPAQPGAANLPGCVDGCSIWARDEFFRERGLDREACDVSVSLQVSEAGDVVDAEIVRGDADSACGRVMRDWALSTRWEAAPGKPDRWFTVGMRPPTRGDESRSGEAAFRTYSAPDLDPSNHILLVHPDPGVTLEDLRAGYGSGLGPVVLVDEARSRSRALCTMSRDPNGAVVLRVDPVGGEVALDAPGPRGIDPQEIVRVARRIHPELRPVVGDLLKEGGSCFLLLPGDMSD